MKSLLFITLCLLVVSSSMAGWSDCDSNGISRKTVELGTYLTKEKCSSHCGNSCNTECGGKVYSWNCHRESAQYKCKCTCAMYCHEI